MMRLNVCMQQGALVSKLTSSACNVTCLCRVPPNHKSMKIMLVFICLMYLLYTLNAPYLRGVLGIQKSSAGDFVDNFQPTVAMALLAFNTFSLFAS